ncbi:V-type ATPase subunit [archaeon]|nr:V-type ATPase subunit [archaeon]
MKSHLLDGMEMKTLIESRNFDDALALLKNTAYGKELSKLSSPSLIDVENVLQKAMLTDYGKLAISVTGASKKFLAHYAKKAEIEAIKTLLIMKTKGEEVKDYPWILERIMAVEAAEKLVDVGTPGEIVEMLRFTEYYTVLHKAVSEATEQDSPYPFIEALDTYFYSRLNSILRKMGGKDRKIVEHLVGIEVDAKNLLIALRTRGTGGEVTGHLMPMRYRLSDPDLQAAFNIKSIGEVQQIFQHYNDIISQGVKDFEDTGSFFGLESGFQEFKLKQNKRLFGGDRFHMGIPIAFLNLKSNEIRNLTAILQGKEESLSVEQIEKTVSLLA